MAKDLSMEEISRLANKNEGFLLEKEGRCLYRLASMAKGDIVEIGSYKGKSTVWLAYGSMSRKRDKGRVFAVDPHGLGTEKEFRRNIKAAGISHHVTPIVMNSWDAAKKWKKKIGMVWIDGSHFYEDVEKDFKMWSKFVVPGGIIAFHDTVAWNGPRRVVEDHVHGNRKLSHIRLVGSITYARNSPSSGIADMIQDHGILIEKRIKNLFWRCVYGGLGLFIRRFKELDDHMTERDKTVPTGTISS